MRAPKAQVSARKRSGKRTAGFEAGSGEGWRGFAGEGRHPPKGGRSRQVVGTPPLRSADRGAANGDIPQFVVTIESAIAAVLGRPVVTSEIRNVPIRRPFLFGASRGRTGRSSWADAHLFMTCTSSSVRAWSISA